MLGLSGMWILLITDTKRSSKILPTIPQANNLTDTPKISIIVPARNESQDIESCISSLITQDYPNKEIILVDDSSTDKTAHIMESFAAKHKDIITAIHAKPKPAKWMGKTWACVQGVKHATGEILLFTDADTIHAENTLSDTIHHMITNKIDALTITQKLSIPEIWTSVTMPVITSFKLVYPNGMIRQYTSAINDPDNKVGGMLGAFIMIKRKVYHSIGGFESVKNDILEDWVIGNKIKSAGHTVKIAKGDHLVSAVWARDLPTLKEIFKRLMIPFVVHDRNKGIKDFILIASLLIGPSVCLPYFVINYLIEPRIEHGIMLGSGIIAMLSYMASFRVHAKMLGVKSYYFIISPVGGFVATIGFLVGLIGTKRGHAVNWHDRIIDVADV